MCFLYLTTSAVKLLQTEGPCKQSLITSNIFQYWHFVPPEDGTLAQKHVGDTLLLITYISSCVFGWRNKTEYTVPKIRIGQL